jgi:hypothetical protein
MKALDDFERESIEMETLRKGFSTAREARMKVDVPGREADVLPPAGRKVRTWADVLKSTTSESNTREEHVDVLPPVAESRLERRVAALKSTKSRLDKLEKQVADLHLLRSEVADLHLLRSEVADLHLLRSEVATLRPLRDDVATLRPFRDEVFVLRRAILDGLEDTGRDWNLSRHRNRLAHGGHIVTDLSMIHHSQTKGEERCARWKRTFERLYGVKYDMVQNKIPDAQEAIIDAYNMRVDVTQLDMWKEPTHETHKTVEAYKRQEERAIAGREIKSACDQIIQKWESWLTTRNTNEAPSLGEEHRVVRSQYDHHYIRGNTRLL